MWRANPLHQRISERLALWKADGLLRTLQSPAGIDLSSNDYLNLSCDPRVVNAFVGAARRGGVGSTGSRLLRGHRDAFAEVEAQFAAFKGTERALYFSSGYLANLAVLTTLTESGDVVFSDALNHASLIDGLRLSRARRVVFPHNDLQQLSSLLESEQCGGLRFVVVESVFSMDGDFAPLAELGRLCDGAGAVLVVDEAHAVGVFGARGTGLIEQAALDPSSCISVNTAGKALGVAGAFVAGPATAIEYLVQRARPFVFSTAPPPPVADAIKESLSIVESEPERRQTLLARAAYLRGALKDADVPTGSGESQIVPVPVGDNARAVAMARHLADQGFDVRAIRPPSVPAGTARLRASVNAALSEEVLDRFVRATAAAFREAGLCSAVSS
jgi:8-amino-7-oxononanoate synthase